MVKICVTRIESESENCNNCGYCCFFLPSAATQNALLNVSTPFRSSYRASNGPHQWAAARSASLMSSHYLQPLAVAAAPFAVVWLGQNRSIPLKSMPHLAFYLRWRSALISNQSLAIKLIYVTHKTPKSPWLN